MGLGVNTERTHAIAKYSDHTAAATTGGGAATDAVQRILSRSTTKRALRFSAAMSFKYPGYNNDDASRDRVGTRDAARWSSLVY